MEHEKTSIVRGDHRLGEQKYPSKAKWLIVLEIAAGIATVISGVMAILGYFG